jgi:hypothetical protein
MLKRYRSQWLQISLCWMLVIIVIIKEKIICYSIMSWLSAIFQRAIVRVLRQISELQIQR